MMKKMVSMAMAAVMAATLMVAAAPTEVKAAEDAGSITVSYTQNVVDPENPEVYLSIPGNITFTAAGDSFDADVKLVDANKNLVTSYTGTAAVTVKSTNGYKLASSGETTVPYELTYDTIELNSTIANPMNAQAIGTMGMVDSSLVATLEGTATLPADSTVTVAGTYTDTLTYAVEFVAGE